MSNANAWDDMSNSYPRYNDSAMKKDVNFVLNWCEEIGVRFEGKSIIDIGCGTGTVAIPLASKGAKVCGIDLSPGMLEVLENDAKTLGIDSLITTFISDWDSYEIKDKFDIVLTSLTPALHSDENVIKAFSAAKDIGIYVGWGDYKKSKFLDILIDSHKQTPQKPVRGCIKAAQFKDILDKNGILFKTTSFESSWENKLSMDQAINYSNAILKRCELIPDSKIIDEVLAKFQQNDKVIISTDAQKSIILYAISDSAKKKYFS
ncbi:class I SAM-dependent methyltransferase [Campylobacter fetus]|uniref:Class I SAM-dependent methyltransferase n=3 Tax=Campylobacter fetus TaxID=196 RepID=A0A5L8KV13_CAMFE|nr:MULTISPECIES: class I SAM-dependent methyltransferase [Campylobacter]OCS23255.1 hypothetical protein CFVI97532_00305 [Campylobacter fetus subsp. venerealis cfvi97/532]OCS26790.1 hypothetical protein CFVB10_02855 [Campylobacter fetus subsp. venerealis cfvB10]OCS31457.1 hypothetical protein CFVLMG6570_04935 [Campylobacter fetus subsp. venerealis LMG 6570 = CCUG 33900]OCS38989.1 hypothetical protein CFVI02298_09695 [Campylobacter fetus subsp. venerealis cfvi02/298]ABK83253.1 methyltransferase 